jgi:hypothetical protein
MLMMKRQAPGTTRVRVVSILLNILNSAKSVVALWWLKQKFSNPNVH